MRALAVTSAKRADDLPQVPTIAESGYKGFDAVTWFGIAGPASLPKDVVAKLNADINKALQDARAAQEAERPGRRRGGQHARAVRQADPRRHRPLGQDRQGIGRQGRLTPGLEPKSDRGSRRHPPRPGLLPVKPACPTSFATSTASPPTWSPRPPQYQPAILADVAGRRGALHGRIAALRPRMKLAGPAFTVDVRPGDNLMIHAAMALAKPGDVLVIDGKGDQTAR